MSGMSNLISAFEPGREPFNNYLNWLETQLIVLKVKDTDQQNVLIACIGLEAYNQLKVACLPEVPNV